MQADFIKESVSKLYQLILGRPIDERELDNRARNIEIDGDTSSFIIKLTEELLASEEYKRRYGHNISFQKISDPDIFYAYKFFLGRFPESPEIYNNNRRKPNLHELLKEIISSHEFKTNKILKDQISIRRKPAGIENVLSKGFSDTEKKILVISGCQGKMIADLMQAGAGLRFVESLYLSGDAYNKFIVSKGESHKELLAWADIIFTQKTGIFEVLQNTDNRGKTRLMPLIEYAGLQPDQCLLIDRRSGNTIVGPLGEYQSIILASCFFAGVSKETAVKAFNTETFKLFEYDAIAEASKARLLAQESATEYPMREMFERWSKTGRWMRTMNHPKKIALLDLVKFALFKEELKFKQEAEDFVTDDLAANVDWPSYGVSNNPCTTTEDFELDFKLPKAFSPSANSAAFIKLTEFANLFYQSMNGLTIDVVRCEQLGQKIDLNTLVEKIRSRYSN